jgi:HD-like signal output (HDOD) protein
MNKLLQLVKEKNDLPALPDIVAKLNETMNDPSSSLIEIANVIETDPALSGRIIKLANSALYSAGRNAITDLQLAIGRLGLNEIEASILSLAMLSMFKDNKLIDQKRFWKHGLSVALCAQNLSKIMGASKEEHQMAYLAGLMHEVGILVFAYVAPDSYKLFLTKHWAYLTPGKEQHQLHELEASSFGIDHATLGAAFIKQWWPVEDPVIVAVKSHLMALSGSFVPLIAKIVGLCDLYCNTQEVHNGVQTFKMEISADDYTRLGLTDEQVEKFGKQADFSIEIADAMVGI